MIQKNKVVTYLLYAIGEIVLVVVGILIAVSIDDRNESIKKRAEEKAIIQKLVSEQKADRENLLSMIRQHEWLNNKLDTLQLIINTQDQINIDSIDNNQLDIYLGMMIYMPEYKPQQGYLNSIISSGQISLISNDSISVLIAEWDGLLKYYAGLTQGVYDLVKFHIIPYLAEKHPFAAVTKSAGILKNSLGTKFSYDRKEILGNLKTETLTELKRIDSQSALEIANLMLTSKNKMIELLEKELEKK